MKDAPTPIHPRPGRHYSAVELEVACRVMEVAKGNTDIPPGIDSILRDTALRIMVGGLAEIEAEHTRANEAKK